MKPIRTICYWGLILLFVAVSAPAGETGGSLLSVDRLASWLKAYGEAWEARDADRAARLFTENANYQVTPFEQPHLGQQGIHAYWSGVTKDQRNVRFGSQVISVTGDTGVAHWSAQFDVEPSKDRIELDGIFILDFDENGKCRRLREWWHLRSNSAGGEPE